jgi:hypothetical protein
LLLLLIQHPPDQAALFVGKVPLAKAICTRVPYARKLPGMDSSRLTVEQLRELDRVIGRQLGYLHRLRSRMERTGFPRDDELRQLVTDAEDRMHRLSVALHYAVCAAVRRADGW